jgi:hypothetical protein
MQIQYPSQVARLGIRVEVERGLPKILPENHTLFYNLLLHTAVALLFSRFHF